MGPHKVEDLNQGLTYKEQTLNRFKPWVKIRQRKILSEILLQVKIKLYVLRMYNHKPDFASLKKISTSFYYCQAAENPKAKKLKRFFLMITLYLTKENLPILYRERANLFKLVP